MTAPDDKEDLRYPIYEMVGVCSTEKIEVRECIRSNTACSLRVAVGEMGEEKLFIKTATNDSGNNPFWKLCMREIEFYKLIAKNGSGLPLNIPTYRRHDVLPDGTGYYLVLDDVGDSYRSWKETRVDDIAGWKRVIGSIAYLHSAFGKIISKRPFHDLARREESESSHVERLQNAFDRFCGHFSDVVDDSELSLLKTSIPAITEYQKLKYKRLQVGKAVTIAHGDLHTGNLLNPVNGKGNSLIIDWQFWAVDVGVLDLPHLVGAGLPPDLRHHQKDLVRFYYDALNSVSEYDWADCWADYRMGIVEYLFMPVWQYTGFGWGYDRWKNTLQKAIANFHDLHCDELVR